ncbi:MAG TPA: DUF4105 domain-containing protein [Bacteroidetes bacterium]|nr:DUF4105 domain-containing protein [Bacteroidota bacterium]
MKRFILFVLFLITINQVFAVNLSQQSKVSLMVVGPYYKDFASIWGHVAIWINDEPNNIDKIYNYGGAAYGGNFMMRLVTGNLKFYLDTRQTLTQDLKTYHRAKRDVYLYEINLDLEEKNKLYHYLENNAKEENKFYKYEFYKANCTTQSLDAIKNSIKGKLVYPTNETNITYRKICDDKFPVFPGVDFLIKLIAGSKNDEKLNLEDIFFVPEYMTENLGKAKIKSSNGEKPFFKGSKQIYDFPDPELYYSFYSSALFYILILFFLEIILFGYSFITKTNYFKWYDYFWFAITSVISLFLLYVMLFTHYIVTKWNFNLLWANPLFVSIFFLKGKNKERIFKIISISILFVFVGIMFLPQHFYLQNMLLAGILLMKSLKYGFLKHRFEK